MIYFNREKPHEGTNDEDVYVEDDSGTPVLWQWNVDKDDFDQVQIVSISDCERLIDVLRRIISEPASAATEPETVG